MESTKNLFIISFGDSDEYRMMFGGSKEQLEKSPEIKAVKDEIEKYLTGKIGLGSEAARFASPRIESVDTTRIHDYDSYPEFGPAAVTAIEGVLLKEIENMLYQKQLDSDAPYSDISTSPKD